MVNNIEGKLLTAVTSRFATLLKREITALEIALKVAIEYMKSTNRVTSPCDRN